MTDRFFEVTGCSGRNLKRMLAFFREYRPADDFVQPAVAQLPAKDTEKVPQAVAQMPSKPFSPQPVAKSGYGSLHSQVPWATMDTLRNAYPARS